MRKKPIPTFTSEEEEAEFWDTHSAVDYIDFDDESTKVEFDFSQARTVRLAETQFSVSVTVPDVALRAVQQRARRLGMSADELMAHYISDIIRRPRPYRRRRRRPQKARA